MLGRGSVVTGCRQGRGVRLEEPRSSASAGLELSCIQLLAAGVKVCALTDAFVLGLPCLESFPAPERTCESDQPPALISFCPGVTVSSLCYRKSHTSFPFGNLSWCPARLDFNGVD